MPKLVCWITLIGHCPKITNLNYVHEEIRRRFLLQKVWYILFKIIC